MSGNFIEGVTSLIDSSGNTHMDLTNTTMNLFANSVKNISFSSSQIEAFVSLDMNAQSII
jgi:hypothetical protein